MKYGMSLGDRRRGQAQCIANWCVTGINSIHTLWRLVGETACLWVCPECYNIDS